MDNHDDQTARTDLVWDGWVTNDGHQTVVREMDRKRCVGRIPGLKVVMGRDCKSFGFSCMCVGMVLIVEERMDGKDRGGVKGGSMTPKEQKLAREVSAGRTKGRGQKAKQMI